MIYDVYCMCLNWCPFYHFSIHDNLGVFFGGTSRPPYQAVHCYSIATGAHRCRNIGGGLGHVAMWMILTYFNFIYIYMVYAYPVVSLAAKGIHILTIFHMSHGEPVGASNRVSQPHDSFHWVIKWMICLEYMDHLMIRVTSIIDYVGSGHQWKKSRNIHK